MPQTTDDLIHDFEGMGYDYDEALRLAEGFVVRGGFDVMRETSRNNPRMNSDDIFNQIVRNYEETDFLGDFTTIKTNNPAVRKRVMKAMHTKYMKRHQQATTSFRSSFMVGSRFKGLYSIKEYQDDKVYIPDSEHCAVKCAQKIKGSIIDIHKYNPYGMSLTKIRKMFKENLEEDEIPDIILPKISAINDDGTTTLEFYTTDKKARKNTGNTILLIHTDDEDDAEYHACLVYSDTVNESIYNHIIDNLNFYEKTALSDDQVRIRPYKYKQPSDVIVSYDIETSSKEENGVRMQVPEGISYSFSNLPQEKILYKANIIGHRDSPERYIYDKFIDDLASKYRELELTGTLYVFAHNGGCFDNIYVKGCTNIKIIEQIKKGRVKKLKIQHIPSKVEMSFLDTYPFFQATLKKSCEYFKIDDNKMDFDIVNKPHEFFVSTDEWIPYMEKDVDVLTKIIFKFEKFIRLELGMSITTAVTGIASIAWRLMCNRCYGIQKHTYRSKDPTTTKFISDSRYGGRILHYQQRFLKDDAGGLICLDGNSLFPSAMFIGLFPVGKYMVLDDMSVKTYLKHMTKFMSIVEVEIDAGNARYPLLPYRTEEGAVIYPNGRFRGVYNSVDLQEAVNDGYTIIRVFRGIYWKRAERIFKDLIEDLFNQRKTYKKNGNPMEYVFKILLNSTYGTTSTTINDYTAFSNEETPKKKIKGKITSSRQLLGGQFEHRVKMKYSMVDKPIHLASFILSYSRKIMNNYIRQIGPENIYYGDTDSLYVKESVLNNLSFDMNSDLCGMKNDYGDGIVIEEAIFLDLKRYFVKFNRPSEGCTFKAKFNGLNFKSENALKNWYEADETKEQATKKMYEWFYRHKGEICDIKMVQEKWARRNYNVTISDEEMQFQVNPEVRNNWEGNTSYPIKMNIINDQPVIVKYGINDKPFTLLGPKTEFEHKEGFQFEASMLYGLSSATPLYSDQVKHDLYVEDVKANIKKNMKRDVDKITFPTTFLEKDGILYKRDHHKDGDIIYEFDGNNCIKVVESLEGARELLILKGEKCKLTKEQVQYIGDVITSRLMK